MFRSCYLACFVLVWLFLENLIPGASAGRCQGRLIDKRKCCSIEEPCGVGEGDCEVDDECSGHLICGHNNCRQFGEGFHAKDDCCIQPNTTIPVKTCNSKSCPLFLFYPYYPQHKKKCQGRNVDQEKCCTAQQPCEEREGDCDNDGECKIGLVCGENNCKQFGSIFHDKDDCCVQPSKALEQNPTEPVQLEPQRCQGTQGVNPRFGDYGKCCKPENPCGLGEGDCDGDNQCKSGLKCGENNCKQFGDFFSETDDCCVLKEETLDTQKPRCQGRNVDIGRCCTEENPCDEGEGDCDENIQCKPGLMCGSNNCRQFGDVFHEKDDCCIRMNVDITVTVKPPCQGRNVDQGRCCTLESPCSEGEGDCDDDEECQGNLVCGENNCKQFGDIFHSKDDCCVRPEQRKEQVMKVQSEKGKKIPNEPKPGQRCAGRNYSQRRCCTPQEPCEEGEGDCDGPDDGGQHDGHAGCKGDLVCGSNNCRKFGTYYHGKDDCCERPAEKTSSGLIAPPQLGVWMEPPEGERCSGRNYQGRRCCTPEDPCDIGQGDCDGPGDGGQHDNNAGCKGNLVCGSNNCLKFGAYFHPKDDCCENADGSGGWGEWQSWSACTKSCGAGKWSRSRYCKGPNCPHTTQTQQRFCNLDPCPK